MCCGYLILFRPFFHLGKVLKGPQIGTSALFILLPRGSLSPLISFFLPGTIFFAPHPFLGETLSVGQRYAEKMPAPHYDNPKWHLAPMKIDFLLLPYCLFMALISVIIYEVSRNWFNCLGDHLQEVSFVRYMSTGQAQWAPDGEFKQRWLHLSVHPGDAINNNRKKQIATFNIYTSKMMKEWFNEEL